MRRIGRALQFLAAALIVPSFGRAQTAGPPEADRVRLAEAFRLAERVRGTVWPGWERTPMAVLLVADSAEYLVAHPAPTAEFASLGRDPLLGREVLTRPRRFQPTLLATFPAVGGISTIVVGSAGRTGKSSAEWVLTLLHEHFHQWQQSLPAYYARASDLGLARGDTTGQWMLDYAFPYDSARVQRAVRTLGAALAGDDLHAVAEARECLRRLLSEDDYRYLEFQLWQEGVPRYLERATAEAAAGSGEPDAAFRALPDYEPYEAVARRLRERQARQLAELRLGADRRVGFYPLGAGVAALLVRSAPGWREAYERQPFSLLALVP
jgi:hypothetical protein